MYTHPGLSSGSLACTAPFGLYEYIHIVHFGMLISPASFQRTVKYLLRRITGVTICLDDIYSDTFETVAGTSQPDVKVGNQAT